MGEISKCGVWCCIQFAVGEEKNFEVGLNGEMFILEKCYWVETEIKVLEFGKHGEGFWFGNTIAGEI